MDKPFMNLDPDGVAVLDDRRQDLRAASHKDQAAHYCGILRTPAETCGDLRKSLTKTLAYQVVTSAVTCGNTAEILRKFSHLISMVIFSPRSAAAFIFLYRAAKVSLLEVTCPTFVLRPTSRQP